MPDYMYMLESRLSPEQRAVLLRVQELARAQDSNIYLTGGAVRDLISGMPLRDLDFTVEGNPARMVHELEKGGATLVYSDERTRHHELIFAGDVDGSISAARDEYYARPGAQVEIRWSTVMEDLRRRDFSANAVAISLNPASRGLLLDPTNGLADLERRELRALSIHAFTNQPVRLLRALRFCVRMGFRMEPRTQEWHELAMERGLHKAIEPGDAGREVMDVARGENAVAVLKQWESRGLLEVIHPALKRKRPDYESIHRLVKMRDLFASAGLKVRLANPTLYYIFRKFKQRGMAAALRSLEFSAKQMNQVLELPVEAKKLLLILRGSRTKLAKDAYQVLSSARTDLLAFLEVEFHNAKVAGKIRNYLTKWRPLRQKLPGGELESLGVPRGPQFDRILNELFDLQLRGRGKTPEEVTKLLKRLAGIKEEPKKKPREEKGKHGKPAKRQAEKAGAVPSAGATQGAAEAEPEKRQGGEAPPSRKEAPSSAVPRGKKALPQRGPSPAKTHRRP